MSESNHDQPGCGQWLLFLAMTAWLALVPLAVMAGLSALTDTPPDLLVQIGAVAPGDPALPERTLGLLATGLTLGLHLLAFVPLYFATRRSQRKFLRTTAVLLLAIALYQAFNALARLPWAGVGLVPPYADRLWTAALRLVLILPFLLLGLGWLEARRQEQSLLAAWRRVGLRLWTTLGDDEGRTAAIASPALWLALGAAAVVVGPWVTVGSLGSPGTTAANVLQALPNALGEEILFRGLAFAWLWRALAAPAGSLPPGGGSRRAAALGSLALFVAAQGGTVLPAGDWGAPLRFVSALLLGLLLTELTVRAGGSIWPAVIVHLLYDWFGFAFVDPRSQEEIWHWLVRVWAPLAAGALGFLLWLGRQVAGSVREDGLTERSPAGVLVAAGFGSLAWLVVVLLYLTMGVPGFHPDGFLIFLEAQADLGPAAGVADPAERRAWVYRELVDTAQESQANLRAELDRRGVAYRSHYVMNAIEVLERPGLRRTLAGQPGVASVLFQPGMRRYPRSLGVPHADDSGPNGVEWNVREVGADRVWELGYRGGGVVVGSADTGVAWDHPALKAAYRGWDGVAATHDYHWFDAWDPSPEPFDDSGHGTHTTGTVLGRDGENQVGLAPEARWIACRNMRHGLGNPGSYLACMEFLLAPFPLGGDALLDGDPARGAGVVNNSWGCPRMEGCLPGTLELAAVHLRAAGQMMVVSAGNDGPACGTVQDPLALYDAVLTVGAIEADDDATGFSSRGPVTADGSGLRKPDLVAPGQDIRSAVPDGYASLPGTSMAGPHVAGAVALLWSAEPALTGDVERTEAVLIETARRLTVDAVCPGGPAGPETVCACGGDSPDSVPNNVYGWGQVDAWAAVQKVLETR